MASYLQKLEFLVSRGNGITICITWTQDYKTIFMLSSAEHKLLPANKQQTTDNYRYFLLTLAEGEIFYAYEYENANISWHFHIYQQRKFPAQLS